jgi:hypothetical protein
MIEIKSTESFVRQTFNQSNIDFFLRGTIQN